MAPPVPVELVWPVSPHPIEQSAAMQVARILMTPSNSMIDAKDAHGGCQSNKRSRIVLGFRARWPRFSRALDRSFVTGDSRFDAYEGSRWIARTTCEHAFANSRRCCRIRYRQK
jgi:hypothetical protein